MAQENKFVYTPSEAAEVGIHGPKDLPKLMDKAMSLALVPVSKFGVGVVGLTSKGEVYIGVNVELPGLPLHNSIHGEQFLVTNLALNSVEELTHIAVSATGSIFGAPCGHCRQFYQELGTPPAVKILIKKPEDGIDEFVSLESLMPERFGPDSLLPAGSPLLLAQRDNRLVLLDNSEEICSDREDCSHPKCKALAAANRSYAPYSKCPSGVALKCGDEVYRGWYIESVAYNPSLGPVQAALVDFVARSGGKKFEEITEAVLVEKKDVDVSQEAMAKIVLQKIAPGCVFKVLHCYDTKKPE
ncbi:hypothetical protein CARUB_v10006462mg [Capsella rubella]|uniref:cytidine deaminase n=1 Tax=Capsella rubella TaxID=81985 RepID=R0F8S7_9BRAS|nr:cytidine deaminase 6 [Capsella rubella]EOA18021.1 hypothetical protein CARUB_v10006462mg [Capsella rubella]